jgi:hypothetical protein
MNTLDRRIDEGTILLIAAEPADLDPEKDCRGYLQPGLSEYERALIATGGFAGGTIGGEWLDGTDDYLNLRLPAIEATCTIKDTTCECGAEFQAAWREDENRPLIGTPCPECNRVCVRQTNWGFMVE